MTITIHSRLFLGSLNVTFEIYQFYQETCAVCPQGFAVWVCAEDFNPIWWRNNLHSSASGIWNVPFNFVYVVFALLLASVDI